MADTSKLQPIPFPFGGIDYFDAYSDGNPEGGGSSLPVTQSCSNMRGIDMTVSRRRGCARSGLNRYLPLQINVSSNPIQEITAFIASVTDPSASTGQFVMNALNANTGNTGFTLIGSGFQPYNTTTDLAPTIKLYNNVFGSLSGPSYFYQTGVDSATNQFYARQVTSSGTQVWERRFGFTTGAPYIPLGICITGLGGVAIAVHSSNAGSSRGNPGSGGAPGYEVWILNFSGGTDAVSNPYYVSLGGSPTIGAIQPSYNSLTYDQSSGWFAVAEANGLRIINGNSPFTNTLVPFAPSGTLIGTWRVSNNNHGTFYHCFQLVSGATHTNYLCTVPSSSGTVTETMNVTSSGTLSGADVSYDTTNNKLWSVFSQTASNTGGVYSLSTTTLSVNSNYPITNPLGNTSTCMLRVTPSENLVLSKYLGGTASNTVLMLYMSAGSPPTSTVQQVIWQDDSNFPYLYGSVNFASTPASNGTFYNAYIYLAVQGGVVFEFNSGLYYAVVDDSGAGTGQPVLSATAPVIFSAQQGTSLYFADGVSSIYYDSTSDTTKTWSASAGSLPTDDANNTPRLICLWRNRIVQAGLLNDASNWFMSAVGDGTNWNYAPAGGPFQTQAVAGNNSVAGEVGDVINTLIPFSDDLLIFGGNHTIWQMTGDPMAGGQLDLITGITGMPFGNPWCVDPSNSIYFVGSRGGVFIMPASNSGAGQPTRISTKTVDAALEYLDYTKIIVRMAWDDLEQGLHLFLTPISNPNNVISYWYDARNQAWWPDLFANSTYNPLAICVLAGSIPSDRVVLMGGTDGYIRKFDPVATTDDGLPLGSNVLLGPYYNVYLTELQVTLSSASAAVTVKIQTGKDAYSALVGATAWSGTFSSTGRNRSQNPMIYGNVMYINVTGTGFYAIEQIIARMKPGTQSRQRIF